MKKETKIIIIMILTIIAIGIITTLFVSQYMYITNSETQNSENIFAKNIIDPDRMVYRDSDGKYYQFLKGTDQYNKIKSGIEKSLKVYNESGNTLSEEEIDKIHEKEFIEFDYETASKNYIIPLDNENEKIMIKLGTTGGIVVSSNLKNINQLKSLIQEQSKDQTSYEFEYKEMLSRNQINNIEYKYLQQFKQINYRIYQVKIQSMEKYELYKAMCNLAFDTEITEDTFLNNDLILTISMVPKINVKVNIGNIKYTYQKMDDVQLQYTAHLLIVSKIVNTDCIYNTDLTDIEEKVNIDQSIIDYDNEIENLNAEIFVTDFDKFYTEYQNTTEEISKEKAEEVAESGFEQAKRIVGEYEKDTQKCIETEVKPNNFFTRKYNETDTVKQYTVKVYAFSREDEMGNGVEIYVDKKLGKIVGARAFGD